MLGHQNTGWRKATAPALMACALKQDTDRKTLTLMGRLAAQALKLRPAARQILDQLIACFGGTEIEGRLMVWPSNDYLMGRTGLSERAVRYALRHLLDLGVIVAHDSANGKRFCVRSKTGTVLRAYGFDLAPLAQRQAEFTETVERMNAEAARRRELFDRITICRRSITAIILALGSAGEQLQVELEGLVSITPRRDSYAAPDAALDAWVDLQIRANDIHEAAFGGKNSRLIEINNEPPIESCQNGYETKTGAKPRTSIADLADACPQAMDYLGHPQTIEALNTSAGRIRGGFGVNPSAWFEAQEQIGQATGPVFAVALQFFENAAHSAKPIQNLGGLFRTMMREVAQGTRDLHQDITALRFKRKH